MSWVHRHNISTLC